MSQFHIPHSEIHKTPLLLSGEEAHHALHVFRLKIGDTIQLFDGQGHQAVGRITELSKKNLTVAPERIWHTKRDTPTIRLAQSVLPRTQMEWSLQKSVELGATDFIPMRCQRSQRSRKGDFEVKIERWQKIAMAAAKQCDTPYLIGLHEPRSMPEVLQKFADCFVVAGYPQGESLKKTLQEVKDVKDVLVLVGPEGGFSPEEEESLKDCGAHMVDLGRQILRSETAAIFLVSAVHYALRLNPN